MSWSETGYSDDVQTPAETSDKKLDNSDSRTENLVHSTTDFLAKFDGEGNISSLVSDCIKEISANPELQAGFEKLLKSGISEDIIDKIKQELKDGVEFGLDEITMKDSVRLIIRDAINGGFRVYSMNIIEGINKKVEDKETAAQDKETAAQKGADTVQIEETAAQDKKTVEEIEKNLDTEEIMKEVIKERDRLVDKYQEQNFDAKTNKESTNFQTVKTQLENNGVLNQLRQTHDDKFIDDYILAQTTLLELKSNRSSYEESDISFFDGLVKRLDNACNIPDTSLSSFSPDNIAHTRTELFNKDSGIGNESLKTARDNNMASHEKDYNEMFPEKMGEEDIMKKYGSFLEGQLKQFLEDYLNNTGGIKDKIEEIKKNDNPTEEDKRLLQIYNYMIAELDKNRREAEEQTKKIMEEMCLISQIKGMSMCIGQENGKDFNLNKANEIQNDNGVLTLKGHIDGVDFSVRHDTINPNQRLKIKSKLGVDSEDQNTFEIGKEDNYVNSPFILPSQEEIFGVITKVVQSNDLSKSSDLSKYLESLQNSIIGRMDEVYKDAEFAHHYITNKVKGEKILDSSLSLIQGIKPDIDLTKPINQASNEKLHSLLKIINFNIENSTTEEKNKLNQCITKIQDIKNTYRNNSGNEGELSVAYPPIIEHYLKNEAWLNDGDEESKLGLVVDLLSYYNQNSKDTRANLEGNEGAPSKMIIEDLYRDLFEFQSNQSLVAATRNNNETEKHDKQEADDILDLNNSAIWPPVGEVA